MHQARLIRLLLLPSVTSLLLAIIVSVSVLCITAWSYISQQQLLYGYLFGPYGIKTFLLQSPDNIISLRNAVLGSAFTYYLFVFVAAVIAGLMVFTMLEIIRHIVHETTDVIHEMRDHRSAARELIQRLILRLASILGWAIFTLAWIVLLIPAALLLEQTGIDKVTSGAVGGWPLLGIATLLIAISVHVHIIFARLSMLRPRLFGDQDIEAAEA